MTMWIRLPAVFGVIAILFAVSAPRTESANAMLPPLVIADYSLPLSEAPEAIVPAGGGTVWIAAGSLQAFIRIDVDSGSQTRFAYANGGAAVLAAAAGSDGSLWYLDGLNTEAVWHIHTNGAYGKVSLNALDQGRPVGISSVDGGSSLMTASFPDALVHFDASGERDRWTIPSAERAGGAVAASPDGTSWYSMADGIDWHRNDGTAGSVRTRPPTSLVACSDKGVAFLSWVYGPGTHADDYVVGWVTEAGALTTLRRWPAPSPTPIPTPVIRAVTTVGCGICGGAIHRAPQRSLGLLSCTSTTTWVQVDDSLDRLSADGKIRTYDIGTLIAMKSDVGQSADLTSSPRKWIYSVKEQRLIELELR